MGEGNLVPCIDYEEKGVMLSSCINPETRGQYTGLRDKNGIRIFEGDVVQVVIEECEIDTAVVYYDSNWAAFAVYYVSANFDNEQLGGLTLDGCEVIDNEWDDPELTEVQNRD